MNDGSTDSTAKILKVLLRQYSNRNSSYKLVVLDQENSGEANAVNAAFEIANGEFVSVVNADDPVLPGCFASLLLPLIQNSDLSVSYVDWLMTNPDGEILRKVKTRNYSKNTLIGDFECIPGPGTLIRKSSVRRAYLRDPNYKYISDFELWCFLASQGDFIRIPEFLATWQRNPTGLTEESHGITYENELKRLFSQINNQGIVTKLGLNPKHVQSGLLFILATQKFYNPNVKSIKLLAKSIELNPKKLLSNFPKTLLISIALLAFPITQQLRRVLKSFGVVLFEK